MKPMCIYHKNCADGFTAAWVVAMCVRDVELIPAAYGDNPPDVTDRIVYVVDFSYPRAVLYDMANRAEHITVLDHHATAVRNLAGLAHPNLTLILDETRSGCQITADHFNIPRRGLIDYAGNRDLWRFDRLPHTREINAVIGVTERTIHDWTLLAIDVKTRFDELVAQGTMLLRQERYYITEIIRTSERTWVIGNEVVPVVNAPGLFASEIGNALAARPGVPFAATYYDATAGRLVSLRSAPTGADVSLIAQRYGGGGHPHAAGFRVPHGWEGDFKGTSV